METLISVQVGDGLGSPIPKDQTPSMGCKINSHIRLRGGWRLTFDYRDDDSLQGFVHAPNGDSASLEYALACGVAGDYDDTKIPALVMMELKLYKEYE